MVMAASFDTLTYAKRLKAAGFTEQQAEAQAGALRAVVDENLATKQDLKALGNELRHEMKEMESRITIRLGGLICGATAVLAVLMKLL